MTGIICTRILRVRRPENPDASEDCPGTPPYLRPSWGQFQVVPGSIVCETVLTETWHLAAREARACGRGIEFIQRLRLHAV
jgi:hypothetical protein